MQADHFAMWLHTVAVAIAMIAIVEGAGSSSNPTGSNMGVGSPCPAVFRYEWDGVEWYGIITAPSLPYGTPARLIARLSIGRMLPTKYAGSLELVGPRAEVLHAMLNEQPIRYKVNFPLTHPLPLVTGITLNDRLICSGPIVSSPIVTSITLEHTLYPHGQALNSRGRPQTGQFPPDVVIDQQPPFQQFDPENDDIPNTSNDPIPESSGNANTTSFGNASVMSTVERNLYADVCGVPVNFRPLVANGEVTKRGSHPWLAALFVQKTLGLEFTCGGTLINNKFVITAAHCIRYGENRALNPDEVVVVLGKYRIRRWTERGSVVRDAARIIVHPEYRAISGDADLAVIELSEPVRFTETVRPVCAWAQNGALAEDLAGQEGTIVGWGRDETGLKVTSEPRQTKVKIVSQEDCLRSRLEFRYITSNRTLCAGGVEKGSGPCSGDSGGGLFLQGPPEGRWYLRGVISMSLADPTTKSCDLEQYSVFVDLTKFNGWLEQFLG